MFLKTQLIRLIQERIANLNFSVYQESNSVVTGGSMFIELLKTYNKTKTSSRKQYNAMTFECIHFQIANSLWQKDRPAVDYRVLVEGRTRKVLLPYVNTKVLYWPPPVRSYKQTACCVPELNTGRRF